jgi:hypothetical protein
MLTDCCAHTKKATAVCHGMLIPSAFRVKKTRKLSTFPFFLCQLAVSARCASQMSDHQMSDAPARAVPDRTCALSWTGRTPGCCARRMRPPSRRKTHPARDKPLAIAALHGEKRAKLELSDELMILLLHAANVRRTPRRRPFRLHTPPQSRLPQRPPCWARCLGRFMSPSSATALGYRCAQGHRR